MSNEEYIIAGIVICVIATCFIVAVPWVVGWAITFLAINVFSVEMGTGFMFRWLLGAAVIIIAAVFKTVVRVK